MKQIQIRRQNQKQHHTEWSLTASFQLSTLLFADYQIIPHETENNNI